jgi:hypothetical protein
MRLREPCWLLFFTLLSTCTSTGPASSTQSRNERVLGRADFDTTVKARLGDVLRLSPPMSSQRWQLTFNDKILEITAPPKPDEPGGEDWLFKAIAAGETPLVVTPLASEVNPPRFGLQVVVEK